MNAQLDMIAGERETNLIALAVQHNAPVETLERLMTLQERWDAQQSRKEYYEAIARFQAACPPIAKVKKVKYGNTEYNFAPLDVIAETIREPLKNAGLSYRWEMEDSKEELKVTCIVTHSAGHSERTTMSACPDDSGAKNEIQQRGSAVTYLQRYTLIGALGLTTANEDDDGKSAGALNVERIIEHNSTVREYWMEIAEIKAGLLEGGDMRRAAEYWIGLDQEIQRALWLAPTKGGIFTTKEREQMKSDEFAAIVRELKKGNGNG